MNSSDPAQPKVFRRRKSSVWSINAESRTDNGLEKFIERKTDFRTFFILDFETGKLRKSPAAERDPIVCPGNLKDSGVSMSNHRGDIYLNE